MPALERVSLGLLALLCLGLLTFGGILAWRAHARAPGRDIAGAVLVMAAVQGCAVPERGLPLCGAAPAGWAGDT